MTPIHLIPAWVDEALCAEIDPEAFFPPPGGTPKVARKICRACPVKVQCLAWALEQEVNEEGGPIARSLRFGIFGGLNPSERARLAGRAEEAPR